MPENVLKDLSRACESWGVFEDATYIKPRVFDEPSALEFETGAKFSCPKMLRTPVVATEFETTVAVEGMALKSLVFYFCLGLSTKYSRQ